MERSIDEKLKMIENLRMNSTTPENRSKDRKIKHSAPVRKFLTGVFIRSSIAGAIFIGLFMLKDKDELIYRKVKEQLHVFEMNDSTKTQDTSERLENTEIQESVDFGERFSYNKKD